jgi:two-component system chemotaxis response regulator CheY
MNINILLVDDSATTRAVIRKTLALAGVPVAVLHEAADGAAALRILADHPIDLMFADLNMPHMTGDELIRRMADDPRLSAIPVIVISTEGSRTRLEEIERHHEIRYIRKPFTPEQIREVVSRTLEAVR